MFGRASSRPASQGSINAEIPSDPIPPKQTPTAAEGRGRKIHKLDLCPRLQFFSAKESLSSLAHRTLFVEKPCKYHPFPFHRIVCLQRAGPETVCRYSIRDGGGH